MKNLVTITIPVYKDTPNASEIASYNQCLKILGKYPITLFVPSGMSTENYDTSAPNVNVLEVPHRYLSTREAYSAFMLDQNFYKQFINSEYILIYQLDAWVFRDELEYWCKQGYHYIGAPWSHKDKQGNVMIGGVGNGGFSLRHVEKSLEVLDEAKKCRESTEYYSSKFDGINNSHGKTLAISLVIHDPENETSQGCFYEAARTGKYLHAEDGYWAGAAPTLVPDFKIPVGDIAYKFAMEGEAPTLYKLNNNTLPFGCHAWLSRTSDFWNEFIKYDHTTINKVTGGRNGADSNIISLFYKYGDPTAESKAHSIKTRYPHIKIKSCEMADRFQVVDNTNQVLQEDRAGELILSLLSPIIDHNITSDNRIPFRLKNTSSPIQSTMIVDSLHNAFSTIKQMLLNLYNNDPKYSNVVFLLGYNVLDVDFPTYKKRYLNKHIIVYQLEQLLAGSMWDTSGRIKFLQECDEVWDYDQGNIDYLTSKYNLSPTLHPLVNMDSLKDIDTLNIDAHDIDILFYGHLSDRRKTIVNRLKIDLPSVKIVIRSDLWGDELKSYIQRAKIVLNLHYFNQNRQEQARMFYLVSNNKCVVSEYSSINYFGDKIIECSGNDMSKICKDLLSNGKWYNT